MPRKLLVTNALPYANGDIHLGHLVGYIQADVWVRFQRMRGHAVHYVCADDTHGTPVMLRAEKEGLTPEQLIERVHGEHLRDFTAFGVAFDNYHSTHSAENRFYAEDIYGKLNSGGLIDTRSIEQYYDPVKQMFLPDRFIKGECPKCGAADQYGDNCEACGAAYAPTELKNPYSAVSGAKPVLKTSEHYFFRLSDERAVVFLREWTRGTNAAGERRLQTEAANKMKEWLGEEGENKLSDWDISRDAPYFGFEIPGAPGKYFYAWLDAPIGRQTRALTVEAELAPGSSLRPGMFAEAQLTLGQTPMAVVPRSALVKRGSTWRLFVVVKGHLEERVVQLGPDLGGDKVALLRGAVPGDKVAVKIGENVTDGVRVE